MEGKKDKPVSKRMRFEVFKRDSFTCQYCGKKAPEVILEVDHIEPLSKGGKTVMLNLVTACYECNRGKRNIKLSDNSVIEKQQKALQELSEKQEQLKMLLKWRSELLKIEDQELKAIKDHWTTLTGYYFNDSGMNEIKKLLKKYGLMSILESIDITERYLRYENGKVTEDSVELAFSKIKGICYIKSLPEEKRKEYEEVGRLKYFMRTKYRDYNDKMAPIYINKFIKAGYGVEELAELIDDSDTYSQWTWKIRSYNI
jgi:translation initiation factor 2 alpha subunit (eIF-2alpha)